MKKGFVLLLSAALTAGMLSACGTGAVEKEPAAGGVSEGEKDIEKSSEQRSDESVKESKQEENIEPVTVTIWDNNSGMKEFLDEIVENFNATIGKENHVELVMEHMENESYIKQLGVAFQNGVGPDIAAVSTNSVAEFGEKGYLAPLDEISGLEQLIKDTNAVQVVNENAWGGKMYMLPSYARVIGLAYDKDMFVKAGIVDADGNAKPPATIAEMVEDAKLLTDAGSQQFGFCAPMGWKHFVNYYLAYPSQSSSGIVNGCYDYRTGQYDFNGMKDWCEALLQMKENGSIYPGAENLKNDPARARFGEGGIGMMTTAEFDCAVWNDQFPAKCDWGVAPLPVKDADHPYLQFGICTYSYGITAKGINDGKEDAIALVFNYLYGEEMQILRCERGISIPWNREVIEKCDFSGSPKGWDEYCQLRKISVPENYPARSCDLNGLDEYSTEFINNVWSGKQSLDDWITDMTKRYNDGAKRFLDNNPGMTDIMAERVDASLDLSR